MLPAMAIIVSADILRFNSEAFNKFYISVLGPLMRRSEKKDWNGVIWFLAGVLCVLRFLPEDIATLSVALLAWCDTSASVFGRALGHYGPNVRNGKSLIGSIAAVMAGIGATYVFFGYMADFRPQTRSWQEGSALSLLQVSAIGGLIAGVSEAVNFWRLDDNFIIPCLSGGLLWFVLVFLGLGVKA